ncbi:MAG: DUF3108 domain-containing protein [Crocinitomicaceae bacterium]
MKKLVYLSLFVFLALSLSSSVMVSLPSTLNKSFQPGEKLRYLISYGFIDAGEATLEVNKSSKRGNNRELIHVKGIGRTLGGFNSFFKVYDVYESYIDKKGVFPWQFVRRVDEGGYLINQDYTFQHEKSKVKTAEGKEFKVPVGIQDMLSSFYYARTLNFSNIKVNDIFEFNCFMDEEIFPLKIKYVGEEVIHIRKGKFKCMKFVPVIQTGRLFQDESDVNFWVTSDDNHIPILVKAKIPVGSIKMHLVEWSGLKNPLSSKLEKR